MDKVTDIFSVGYWILLLISFFFGVIARFLLNRFLSPRINVDEEIHPDSENNEPYIKVRNNSCFKWNNAYDIQIYITYYNKDNKPILTKIIRDGVIRTKKGSENKKYARQGMHLGYEPYSIIPQPDKQKKDFESLGLDYEIHVVVIYCNFFSHYSIVEQDCHPDKSTPKGKQK